jgi:hypothetical protein
VCLLPRTRKTEGLLNLALLRKLKRDGAAGGAWLVNAGRGQLQVDADIVSALDEGMLAGATLDVFRGALRRAGTVGPPAVTVTPPAQPPPSARAGCEHAADRPAPGRACRSSLCSTGPRATDGGALDPASWSAEIPSPECARLPWQSARSSPPCGGTTWMSVWSRTIATCLPDIRSPRAARPGGRGRASPAPSPQVAVGAQASPQALSERTSAEQSRPSEVLPPQVGRVKSSRQSAKFALAVPIGAGAVTARMHRWLSPRTVRRPHRDVAPGGDPPIGSLMFGPETPASARL